MEYVLITLTLLSAAVAVAMGVLVVTMMRNERQRSDARVEALIAMAGAAPDVPPAIATTAPEPPAAAVATRTPPSEPRPARATGIPGDDLESLAGAVRERPSEAVREPSRTASVSTLFAEPEQTSPWGARLGIAAAVLTFLVLIGFAVVQGPFATGPSAEGPSAEGPLAEGPLANGPYIELVSLGHTQKADGLTISGVVQNPSGAAALSQVSAIAFLFDAGGTLLASGRAPLDFSILRPGDESPFVITVPVSGPVARYRIGFRDRQDGVVGHLDRRRDAAVARREGS